MPVTKTPTAAKNASSPGGTRPTVTSARQPKWMRSGELAEPLADVADKVDSLEGLSRQELSSATRQRLKGTIEFITNEGFDADGAGEEIFSTELSLAPRQSELGIAAIRRSGVDLPVHLGRLCEAPLLKPEQERQLFQRMNFLRHQAAKHQSMLNVQRPSRVRLELIQRLLAMADWHRDRIVEANLRLVFSIVKKFVNQTNNFDELLSDGIIAIMRAVEKFDYDRGFRFSTYATQVVRRNAYRTVMSKQEERAKGCGRPAGHGSGHQRRRANVSDQRKTVARLT